MRHRLPVLVVQELGRWGNPDQFYFLPLSMKPSDSCANPILNTKVLFSITEEDPIGKPGSRCPGPASCLWQHDEQDCKAHQAGLIVNAGQ